MIHWQGMWLKVRPSWCSVCNQVDFTEGCKEQLTRQQKKRVKDHRMDYDLRAGCKNDVPRVQLASPCNLFERICDVQC